MLTMNVFRSGFAAALIFTSPLLVTPAVAWPDDDNSSRPPLSGARTPVAPGQLRTTGELRPVGGGLRPVGGNIRPTGGALSPVGSGIRPIEVRSPLQDDRSFNARLRPRTPVYGVTGTVVEPGFDNPPWSDIASGAAGTGGPSGAGASFGRVVIPGRHAANYDGPIGIDLSALAQQPDAPGAAPRPSAAYDLDAARAAAAARTNTVRSQRASQDDRGWYDAADAAPVTSPRDVRAEVRLAARLASAGADGGSAWADAVTAMRSAVYTSPEAFAASSGGMFTADPAMQERLRTALAACGPESNGRVNPSDAAFMRAAISAAIGESGPALDAIRQARDLGEDRPSGKALHRVLSRARPADAEAQP